MSSISTDGETCLMMDIKENKESKSELCNRLGNMMEMTSEIMRDFSGIARFSHISRVSQHRINAIRWIKDVVALSHVSVETRDSGIQILDRFLGVCLSENKNILGHSADVALAAAASVLIASKIHESTPLSVSSFSHLKKQDLVAFERIVLNKLRYALYPLCTPAAFIQSFIELWPHFEGRQILTETAYDLVGGFFEAPESPHFSPSTVALSALLISFSKIGKDCTEWLDEVPNICLPNPNHPIFNTPTMLSYLDVDNCLAVFQRVCGSPTETVPMSPCPSHSTEDRLVSPNSTAISSPVDRLADKHQYPINLPQVYSPTPNYLSKRLFEDDHHNDNEVHLKRLRN